MKCAGFLSFDHHVETYCLSPSPVVLCVDDDKLGLLARGYMLRSFGYCTVLMSNPELVCNYDLRQYQLAIVDLEMPGCNGIELLRRIRAGGGTMPAILLTGALDSVAPSDVACFDDALSKSEPIYKLRSALSSLLAKRDVQN